LVTKQEGATDGVPDWAPGPVVVEILSELPELQSADTDVDNDSKLVSMIGSLEEEGFQTGEDQTLWHSNRVRKLLKQFKFEAMVAEILDTTTDAEGAEFKDLHSPAPGEIFCMKAMFRDEAEAPDDPLLAFAASNDPNTLYLHEE
jgi:hypothetical protein